MNRRAAIKMLMGGAVALSGILSLSAIANFMGNLKADDAISKITGGKHTASADLKLKTPKLAENGSQVPVTVDATALTGVKSVFLIVHENLKPVAMRVDFESADVAAFASFRVKMGKPTKVTAIAHTANGFVTANGSTKVTKGGC
ncbi:thiosulfate oxidation carrier protein SoxY [Candidatus Thioglobus autotrophicus]|uniref:thiosulfate oxidation carrier protein SoxY n=1 Tax=Candidatus Thioglobus autotrophicus TaxID=1705394 RepID=UPI00299CFAA7|nr:thiosulfate oxidation carrier protein SoxY [Candidatus Thioglobus autotrophicus]WPE17010.1 thiosulfate oxidation carrier protein SoxY [Candidatus Thioglobus autotrophicus]WPE18565.1 thiosulfate oxidation carrier protein SoxY [Candidatus Thioglobus autotrophicus]